VQAASTTETIATCVKAVKALRERMILESSLKLKVANLVPVMPRR